LAPLPNSTTGARMYTDQDISVLNATLGEVQLRPVLLFRAEPQARPSDKNGFVDALKESQPPVREVDAFQIGCRAVGKKNSSTTKRVAHWLTGSQKPNHKILSNVGSRRERKIKVPSVKELKSSQKFDPQKRKGVVLSPPGVVLCPGYSHHDHFIH